MTENIFENGGEFCMRGDPEHKPVEWHWFRTHIGDWPVTYVDKRVLRTCALSGENGVDSSKDLIPIPSPPQIVPWESPDDVPDDVWFREKGWSTKHRVVEYRDRSVLFGEISVSFLVLFANYEYHTDRRAKDGWQPCGKVLK